MACWIVVPVKAPGDGKTRLAGVLDAAGRDALVARMLAHVVAAARGVAGAEVVLLGPSRHGLDDDLRLLADPGGGLDAALASVVPAALAAAVDRLVIVPGDLPRVTAADIAALAALAAGVAGLAPDRAGAGTNALSLPLPQARGFAFAYGPDSFARHGAEAARLGLALHVRCSAGLAFDIDLPADLARLDAMPPHRPRQRDGDT